MSFPFWELTLSGLIVSAPTIIVTVWLSNRSVKSHLDKRTAQQTGDIRGITDDQTNVLLSVPRTRLRDRVRWPWA